MRFGYARVLAEEPDAQWEKLLELVGDDRFVFADRPTREYERKNYLFLRKMLRSGDTLYVDGLDSLGGTLEEMAEEWRSLTQEMQVDVVVLDAALQLDSRRFRALGDTGQLLEQQMLDLLCYVAQLQRRKQLEQQRISSSAAGQSGKRFGRPPLKMDWELFHQTAQRWADGEIDVEQACALTGTARSSWYKYAKEMGYARNGKRVVKK